MEEARLSRRQLRWSQYPEAMRHDLVEASDDVNMAEVGEAGEGSA